MHPLWNVYDWYDLSSNEHIDIVISDEAKQTLLKTALDNLSNGGRGIGNVVENLFINPLARFIFDNEIQNGTKVEIKSVDRDSLPISLVCEIGDL